MKRRLVWVTVATIMVAVCAMSCMEDNGGGPITPPPPECSDDSSWVRDSVIVRSILDTNGLHTVNRFRVCEVDSCGRVTELHLDAMGLRLLPSTVSELSELRELIIYNNILDSLPTSIGSIRRLRVLKAQRCGLRRVPDELTSLDSLEALYLFGNQLSRLPDSIGAIKSLRQLNLNGNSLDSLPVSIMTLPNLAPHSIDVAGNYLCTVSGDMGEWLDTMSLQGATWRSSQGDCGQTVDDTLAVRTALDAAGLHGVAVSEVAFIDRGRVTAVDLSNRGLNAFPAALLALTALESLDMSGNAVTAIPSGIDTMTALSLLDLSNNRLDSAGVQAIAGVENLRSLDLSSNLLTSIADTALELDSLRYLDLSDNMLDSLALASWQPPAQLAWLDLSNNGLTWLPIRIGQLTQLRFLDISHNQLKNLPELNGLALLEKFDADNNELDSLPALDSLRSLHVLRLAWNSLSALPPSVSYLDNVDSLDFSHNVIEHLPLEIFSLGVVAYVRAGYNHICEPHARVKNWLDGYAEPNWAALQQGCP